MSTKEFGEKALDNCRKNFGKKERRFTNEQTLDASDPDFQRQMNEMFLLDSLVGYYDRHDENFKVEKTDKGKINVRALDNDMTFGSAPDVGFGKTKSWYSGLPEQMQVDANMAEKIQGMDRETLDTALGHLINKEELDNLWDRFGKMKEYIGGLDSSLLVEKWSKDTAERELKLAGGMGSNAAAKKSGSKKEYTGNNYYQRMLLRLNGYDRGLKKHNGAFKYK